MKPLIIIGAGGHGIETAWLAKRCNRKVKGFLDDTKNKQGKTCLGIPVLGEINKYENFLDCDFIVAIGNSKNRTILVKKLQESSVISFATLIDPTAIVGMGSSVGNGCMILAGSIVTVDVTIGDHCILNINSTVSHGCRIGNFTTIAPNASISGDVVIEEYVEIGANASIREKLTVQSGAFIGMGAVLTKNTERNHVVVGNPAKFLKVITQ